MNTIEKLGDEETFRNIVERTITEFEDSEIELVGWSAFNSCLSLTSVSFPVATDIRGYAFYGCSALTSASIPAATGIGKYAFYNCSALTSALFPVVTSIGESAFNLCTSLTSVSFPAVTSIGEYVFSRCSALTNASLPIATSIGKSTFHSCTSLTSVSFPAATSIGDYAFYGCSALTSVSFLAVTSIGEEAFNMCTSLTSVSFPAATSIKNSAFIGCHALTNVSLPAVTSIGSNAFNACRALTSVSLPAVTSIDQFAFVRCDALISASLPVVTSISYGVFSECSTLTKIYIGTESDTVCTLSDTDAIPSSIEAIYVPFDLLENYKTATNWSSFASKIQAYEVPISCQSLTITAEDVPGYKTSTKVHYEAICTYSIEGVMQTGTKTFIGTGISDTFGKNPSKESPRQIEISYTFLGQTATTTITQGVDVDRFIEVTTSGIATYGWVTASSTYNVDGYDAYMSDSKGKSSSRAVMKITCIGYSELTLYIRSHAEGGYDYTIASKANVSNYPTSSDSTNTLKHTKSTQNSGTTLSSYTAVDYTGLTGNDTIYIVFVKDSSGDNGDDRGFVLIPQE